jgi:hypothetical protein
MAEKEIPNSCPDCGADIISGKKYCVRCGMSIVRYLQDDNRFDNQYPNTNNISDNFSKNKLMDNNRQDDLRIENKKQSKKGTEFKFPLHRIGFVAIIAIVAIISLLSFNIIYSSVVSVSDNTASLKDLLTGEKPNESGVYSETFDGKWFFCKKMIQNPPSSYSDEMIGEIWYFNSDSILKISHVIYDFEDMIKFNEGFYEKVTPAITNDICNWNIEEDKLFIKDESKSSDSIGNINEIDYWSYEFKDDNSILRLDAHIGFSKPIKIELQRESNSNVLPAS